MYTVTATDFFPGERPHGIPGDPGKPEWDALVTRVRGIDTAACPVTALHAMLAREHKRLNAPEASRSRIAAFDDDTVFVVAGQQAGLFGGPLYTLYKAMHTVRLAARLSEETGRTVSPLFWVASDDHDFEEVCGLGIRRTDGTPGRLEYTPGGYRDGMPVGDIVCDDGITGVLDALENTMPHGGAAEEYAALLRDCWRPGVAWCDAFARQMLGVFREWGLVLFDPRWEGAKALFAGTMRAELDDPATSAALVNEEADAFESARLRKQALRRPEGATNLFVEQDGVRHAIYRDEGGFRAGDTKWTGDNLHRLLTETPALFSPGAALRPVCQDAAIPTAALIGGPGERLYLSQLGPLYRHFGVEPSMVWPRAGFTVVEPRVLRNADKENIPLARMFEDIERLKTMLAETSLPDEVTVPLDTLREAVDEQFDRLGDEVGAVDPTLTGSVDKERGRVHHILDGIRGRITRAHKSSLDVSERRLVTASAFLRPDGGAQERWYGMDSILAVLADGGFTALLNATSPGEGYHRIVLPG